MDLNNIETLLKDVNELVKHNNEITRLKGENFNVFRILGLETAENKTHSAFLCELLNPGGTHLKKARFLELFLQEVGCKREWNYDNIKVIPECHIDIIDKKNKTGGRIDIYISDGTNALSIENKIYAGDRETQIERYCNFNKENNKVYYLNLHGTEPDEKSKGELKEGDDFKVISYSKDILSWLTLCLKESADSPILRETIKQYIILIKKLTGELTDSYMEQELKNKIYQNLESASFIKDNYEQAINELKEGFRNEVKACLEQKAYGKLNSKFEVFDNEINRRNAHLFLKHKNEHVRIGIESFQGGGPLKEFNIGIWVNYNLDKETKDRIAGYFNDEGIIYNPSTGWIHVVSLGEDFRYIETIKKLTTDEGKKELLSSIIEKIDNYIESNIDRFLELEKKVVVHENCN